MVGDGGSSAGSYLDDPTSPIPSHCAVIILFKSVAVHQLSWLALKELIHCWCVCVLGLRCLASGEHQPSGVDHSASPCPVSGVTLPRGAMEASAATNTTQMQYTLSTTSYRYVLSYCVLQWKMFATVCLSACLSVSVCGLTLLREVIKQSAVISMTQMQYMLSTTSYR